MGYRKCIVIFQINILIRMKRITISKNAKMYGKQQKESSITLLSD